MQSNFILVTLLILTILGCSSAASEKSVDGRSVYQVYCAVCHDTGVQNAQVIGDRIGWESRLAQGYETLVEHSIDGYMGALGFMPPRGGHPELGDAEIRAAVTYILEQSQ